MANNPQNRNEQSKQRSSNRQGNKSSGGPGRGWHGDPEGHARAGSQSHKNK